jgi:SAM-dependent methyltransferase
VLEIGCGEGRLLLDLQKKVHGLELHGVNKEPWKGFKGERAIRRVARRHGLIDKGQLEKMADSDLPKIVFADAAELPYPDGSFDLVVSQVALFHVERRVEAIAEIYRVLRPGGMALLQLDSNEDDMPTILAREVPRILVLDGEREVPFRAVCEHWRSLGHKIELLLGKKKRRRGTQHVLLKIKKTKDEHLPLCLTPEPKQSKALTADRPPGSGGAGQVQVGLGGSLGGVSSRGAVESAAPQEVTRG